MKKILAGTSALIAAGLLAGAAHAADPITLSVGGYAHWSIGVADNEDVDGNTADAKGDHRMWFTGETTLDNGLNVGVFTSFQPGGRTNNAAGYTYTTGEVTTHKAYVTVGGGFGTVYFGTQDHAAELIHKGAPHVGSGVTFGFTKSNSAGGAWVANPGVAYRGHSIADVGSGADALTYISPSFGGFQVGASYIPTAVSHNRAFKANQAAGFGAGAVYAGEFGGVSVHADAAHVWVDAPGDANVRDWQLGLQLGYAGFSVGAGYSNVDDETGILAGAASEADVWEAGIAYATGPYAVALSYRNQETEIDGLAADHEVHHWQLGGAYTMGPGVKLEGQVLHMDFDNNAGVTNEGWAAYTGVALSF